MRLTEIKATESGLIAALRQSPTDTDARLQLFRLAVINGNWDRADTQLDVVCQLDPQMTHTALVYQRNLACERERRRVFAGRQAPVFLGAPPQWAGYLAQALQTADSDASAGLVAAALEAAEAVPGSVNGDGFDWLADGDSRLGPVLECFIDGKYYWVPFEVLARIRTSEPDDLLDFAWFGCELTLKNGGNCRAYIPTRYPSTELSTREDLRLAHVTEWLPWKEPFEKGIGQRMLVSDRAEYALLDCREILFDENAASGSSDER